LTDDNARTVYARMQYGVCLRDLGRFPEAEAQLLRAFDWLVENNGIESPYTQPTVSHLVTLYEAWGRAGEADRFRALLATDSAGSPAGGSLDPASI
jgi:hypothetical protein